MSAVANIAVSDGTDTRTFVPVGFDKLGAFWWEEYGVAPSAIGNFRISGQLVRPNTPAQGNSSLNRVARVKWTLHAPGLETLGTSDSGLTPPPTLAYIDRFSLDDILSERGTSAVRTKCRKMIAQLVNTDGGPYANMADVFQNVY